MFLTSFVGILTSNDYFYGLKLKNTSLFTHPSSLISHLSSMTRSLLSLFIASLFTLLGAAAQEPTRVQTAFTSPDDLYCLMQDHRGLLWLGSSAGLLSYDGYEVRDWQGGGVEQMMTGVTRLTEDSLGYLWAGTRDGLVRLNLETGRTRAYRLPKQSQQVIFALFTARDGTVYAGTDDGFSVYQAKVDSFYNFNCDNTVATYPNGRRDTVWQFSVKDFAELPDGDILIGTWSGGLLRYSPRRQTFRGYGRLNEMNSALSLSLDAEGHVWIGTWAYGIQRIDRADDYTLSTLQTIEQQSSPVRKICAEPTRGSVRWTRGEEKAVMPAGNGSLWVLTTKHLMRERSDDCPLQFHPTRKSVRALYVDEKGHVNTDSGEESVNIFDILRTNNGDLLMAAEEQGIRVLHPDGSRDVWHWGNRQWLRDNVYAFCQTRDGSLWVGQRMGLSVLRPDGTGEHLDIKTDSIDLTGYFIVNHILEDHNGCLWVSSANRGLVRMKSLRPTHLSSPISHLPITATFEDSHHRLWAYSANGLLLYDSAKDAFKPVHNRFHLPTRKIYSINEDADGVLWLGTGRGLVRLEMMADGTFIASTLTEEDGLPASAFMPRATFRRADTLYFGLSDGYLSFVPSFVTSPPAGASSILTSTPRGGYRGLLVTDILLDGTPIAELDSAFAAAITPSLPAATHTLTIPATAKTFAVEMALLAYDHTAQIRYAYRLEGRDDDWHFLEPGQRQATFTALPTGRYQLHLSALDSHGQEIQLPYAITIGVLPPWYATWWAYLIYIALLSILGWFAWRYLQMQREIEASRRFTAIMQSSRPTSEALREGGTPSSLHETDNAQPSPLSLREGSGVGLFISRATQLVRDHLDDSEYNRDRMAADMGMSASSLFSKLREATGMNIQTFIQNIRLNAAADILRSEPDIRISELAYRVGFNTPKYFSQCFKKEFGMLPGEFIKAEE